MSERDPTRVVMNVTVRPQDHPHPPEAVRRWRPEVRWLSIALALVSALIFLAWALLAALHVDDHYQVDHVGGARMALARYVNHGVIYPPLFNGQVYGGTRFMPLPIVLHALVAKLTGEYLVSGKIVSYAVMLVLLTAMFALLRRLACPFPIALGLTALVLVTHTGLAAGMDLRADGLPLVLQVLAVALVAHSKRPAATVAAAALSALALLSKLSSIWAPLAIVVWLLLTDRRRLRWFLPSYAAFVGVQLAFFGALTHGSMFENVFGLSTAGVEDAGSILRGPYVLFHLLVQQALGAWYLLPAAGIMAWLALKERQPSIYLVSLVCCLAVLVVVLGDIGTGWNQLVDLVVLTALVTGELAGRSWPGPIMGVVVAGVLVLVLVWIDLTGLAVTMGPDTREAINLLKAGRLPHSRPLTGRATSATPLLSEDAYVPVVLGQTPVVLDPFMLLRIGRKDPAVVQQLIDRIDARQFRYVVLVVPLQPVDQPWWNQMHFGPDVVRALARSYRYTGRDQGYYVYEPASIGSG